MQIRQVRHIRKTSAMIALAAALAIVPTVALAQGWGWGWGPMMFFGPFMMILFFAAIVVVVVLVLRRLGGGSPDSLESLGSIFGKKPEAPGGTALDILEERFAKGEIDKDEFEERKRALMA